MNNEIIELDLRRRLDSARRRYSKECLALALIDGDGWPKSETKFDSISFDVFRLMCGDWSPRKDIEERKNLAFEQAHGAMKSLASWKR